MDIVNERINQQLEGKGSYSAAFPIPSALHHPPLLVTLRRLRRWNDSGMDTLTPTPRITS
jgi:hypothetical protein